jgi:hypothetical protein
MDPVRISCPACGLSHRFDAGRTPERLPHHCPRCGQDVVAEGLLVEAAPPGPEERAPPAEARGPHRHDALFPPPPAWEASALALFAGLLAWSHAARGLLAATLSGADLVFHEAGHPIFGLLGWPFLTYLGGTLAQLAFPVAAAVAFARQRRAAPFAVAVVWLGFNLVDVGTYAADASARALPLLAPDEDSHDWWNLLGMLGVREHCRAIGGAISAVGWLLWAGAPAWAAWSWLRARRAAPTPGTGPTRGA